MPHAMAGTERVTPTATDDRMRTMTSTPDGQSPEPDLGPDTVPDVNADTDDDPARSTEDEGWTDEGGATPSGPATTTDSDT